MPVMAHFGFQPLLNLRAEDLIKLYFNKKQNKTIYEHTFCTSTLSYHEHTAFERIVRTMSVRTARTDGRAVIGLSMCGTKYCATGILMAARYFMTLINFVLMNLCLN